MFAVHRRSARSRRAPTRGRPREREETADIAATNASLRPAVNHAGPGSGSRSAAHTSIPHTKKSTCWRTCTASWSRAASYSSVRCQMERFAAQSGSATRGCANPRSRRTGRKARSGRSSGPERPSTIAAARRRRSTDAEPCEPKRAAPPRGDRAARGTPSAARRRRLQTTRHGATTRPFHAAGAG